MSRIALCQFRPVAGNIPANIDLHEEMARAAADAGATAVFFPELSLSGYEPELAAELASGPDDDRLLPLQQLADERGLMIGLGLPTLHDAGIRISLLVLQPHRAPLCYSKQLLHEDEKAWFVPGTEAFLLPHGRLQLAPAICYESLQPAHAAQMKALGADLYIACVAKAQKGVDKAFAHFPHVARTQHMGVLMVNCVGPADDFQAAGQSAVWNAEGVLMAQAGAQEECILLFDPAAQVATKMPFERSLPPILAR